MEGPPVPTAPPSLPSHPAAAGPSLQRLTRPATFPPLCTGPQAQCKRHVSSQLVTLLTASVDALSSLLLGYKIAFPLSSCISPPRPTPPPLSLWKWGFGDSDSKEGRFPDSQEMATPHCSSDLTSLHVRETVTRRGLLRGRFSCVSVACVLCFVAQSL